MQNIIDQKFDEWINGLNETESRVNIFEKIRDIPFVVTSKLFDPKRGPSGMLQENKGFCVPKHYLLGLMFKKLDTPVEYHTFSFKWKELDIEYPEEVKVLAGKIPITYHLACKVLIGEKWILLDTTWDSLLKKINFPVNENWDGESNTLNAVKPIDAFAHKKIEDREEALKKQLMRYTFRDKLLLSKFSNKLNTWLESVRSEGM